MGLRSITWGKRDLFSPFSSCNGFIYSSSGTYFKEELGLVFWGKGAKFRCIISNLRTAHPSSHRSDILLIDQVQHDEQSNSSDWNENLDVY